MGRGGTGCYIAARRHGAAAGHNNGSPIVKFRVLLVALLASSAVGLVGVGTALSQSGPPTISISPTSGPIGTQITATIANCTVPTTGGGEARLDFAFEGLTPANTEFFAPAEDGTATVTIEAMEKGEQSEGLTAAEVNVSQCGNEGFASAPFTVTRATTTTTQATTTTTTVAPGGSTTSAATVSPSSALPGQQVVVAGGGFAPDTGLTVDFFSSPVRLGTGKSDAAGNYRIHVTIPADAAAGPHEIVVSGEGANGQPHRSVGHLTVLRVAGAAVPVRATPTFTG